jgi:hypothetical protein
MLNEPNRPFAFGRVAAVEPVYLQPNMEMLPSEDRTRDIIKFNMSGPAIRSGDSGSAMVNKNGELGALEEAVGFGMTYGTLPGYISEDLDRQAAQRRRK